MTIRYNTTGYKSDRRNGRKGKIPAYANQPSNKVVVVDPVPVYAEVPETVKLAPVGVIGIKL